jgi:twitching motility protein PilT
MNYKQTLDQIIEIVRSQAASDVHFSIGRHPTIRVAGTLIPLQNLPVLSGSDTLEFLTLMLSKEQKDRFLEDKELDYSYSADDITRFRGNAFIQRGGVGIALRYIPRKIPSLSELGLPEILKDFALQKQGFFLVVGPVGQGKTTTLAAMIDLINTTRQEHILTIEDPIEYIHVQKESIIDQREVGLDTDGFDQALHSAFRQDANVIMLGELRNLDTISSAITAAETGHLVFATLHTNDAPQTIDRIIDVFPTGQQRQIRSQLSAALSGILSQRLIPSNESGVVPAYELLINNAAVANLIRDERTHELRSVIETGMDQGMIDMDRSLAQLVKNNQVEESAAMRYAHNPAIFQRYLK